jgi:hypothetical protein
MSDQRGKVLSFGPFELSIGSRLLTALNFAQRHEDTRLHLSLLGGKSMQIARLSFIVW